MSVHERYKQITNVALGIAQANGMINRLEPTQRILDVLDSVLGAEGVYTQDLEALEAWLGTLSAEQLSILEDGEVSEVEELKTQSPRVTGEKSFTARIFEDFWEAL